MDTYEILEILSRGRTQDIFIFITQLTGYICSVMICLQESNCSREDDMPTISPTIKDDLPPAFPMLDSSTIEKYLADNKDNSNAATCKTNQSSYNKVPYGSGEFSFQTRHYINIRKLEVLHDCVAYIFENKISEARKVRMFHAQY